MDYIRVAYMEMPFVRSIEKVAYVRGLMELMRQLCKNDEIPAKVDFKLWCGRESYQEEWFVEKTSTSSEISVSRSVNVRVIFGRCSSVGTM